MEKVTLKPWSFNNIIAEVTSTKNLSEEEKRQISECIRIVSISPCAPGFKIRTFGELKKVVSKCYGKQLADFIVDVEYIK